MWVPFNEGWGQFDTARITDWMKRLRSRRAWSNSASGWTDRSVGDVHDMHVYPGPGPRRAEANRAGVLGEFGGPRPAAAGPHLAGREELGLPHVHAEGRPDRRPTSG